MRPGRTSAGGWGVRIWLGHGHSKVVAWLRQRPRAGAQLRAAPEKRSDPGPGFSSPFTKATSSAGPEPRLPNPQKQGEACSGP